MKAITIRQPWAELIAQGKKNIEVRTWRTNFTGKIAIHAGVYIDSEIDQYKNKKWPFLTGGVIAIADLILIDNFIVEYQYRAFMQFEPGYFAWHLQNIQKIEFLPWRGMPGIFNIDDKLIKVI